MNLTASQMMVAVLKAIQHVFPVSMEYSEPLEILHFYDLTERGVMVGFTGQIKGSLFIQGDSTVFSKLAEAMYGMALEGEMLESFIGEVGNMVAGNVSTAVGSMGVTTDITPPTVMVGSTKLTIRQSFLVTDVVVPEIGTISIALAVEMENEK
jgi:chemotaxis protein CheX